MSSANFTANELRHVTMDGLERLARFLGVRVPEGGSESERRHALVYGIMRAEKELAMTPRTQQGDEDHE